MQQTLSFLDSFHALSQKVHDVIGEAFVWLVGSVAVRLLSFVFVILILVFRTNEKFSPEIWLALVLAIIMGSIAFVFYGFIGMAQAMFKEAQKVDGYKTARKISYILLVVEVAGVVSAFYEARIFVSSVGVFLFIIFCGSVVMAFYLAKMAGHIRYGGGSAAVMLAKEEHEVYLYKGKTETMRLEQNHRILQAQEKLEALPLYNKVQVKGVYCDEAQLRNNASSVKRRLLEAITAKNKQAILREIGNLSEYVDAAETMKWNVSTYKKVLMDAQKDLQKYADS